MERDHPEFVIQAAQRRLFDAVLSSASTVAGGRLSPIAGGIDAGLAAWRAQSTHPRRELQYGALVEALLGTAPIASYEPVQRPTSDIGTALDAVARFWPDGLAAFLCALELYAGPGALARLPTTALRLPLWWSIRENLLEEPGLASPFLQLLAGEPPNWQYWVAVPLGAFTATVTAS